MTGNTTMPGADEKTRRSCGSQASGSAGQVLGSGVQRAAGVSPIRPDSLTGILFAVEGIRNTIVLLNGPMGCKFYHSTTSKFLMDRPPLYLPVSDGGKRVEVNYNYMNDWFFRQDRVPCTYLDHYDYVYGTAEKVEEALRYIAEHVDFDLLTVVNSPGASLIGDNLKELAGKVLPDSRTVHIESPGFSESFAAGYEAAALEVLKQLAPSMRASVRRESGKPPEESCGKIGRSPEESCGESRRSPEEACREIGRSPEESCAHFRRPRVNLLGLSIWHRYAQGDREELTRLLEMCGIEVNCCLFSGCSLDEILTMPQADLNIVIHSDMALQAADYLKEMYGTPCYVCDGLPIGFDAAEKMIAEVCSLLQGNIDELSAEEQCGAYCRPDPVPALAESERSRGIAWYKLNQIYQASGLPKGVSFAVEGTLPAVYSYTRFLGEYLGMIPECLAVEDIETEEKRHGHSTLMEKLAALLEKLQASHPERKSIMETRAELVFSNANTISALMIRHDAFCGIEISLPGMGYTDVIPKTHLGIRGTLFLVEQVLNGLMSKL